MTFQIGERVRFSQYEGKVLEYDGKRYRVQLDGWNSWRWFLPTDLETLDDIAALKAENERLRAALEAIASGINLVDKAEAMGIDTDKHQQPIQTILAIARTALEPK